MPKGLYQLLEVEETATPAEIKKQYHNLALKYHPDKHADKSLDEQSAMKKKFQSLTQAYGILSNRREDYDAGRIDDKGEVVLPFADPFFRSSSPEHTSPEDTSKPPVSMSQEEWRRIDDEGFNGLMRSIKYHDSRELGQVLDQLSALDISTQRDVWLSGSNNILMLAVETKNFSLVLAALQKLPDSIKDEVYRHLWTDTVRRICACSHHFPNFRQAVDLVNRLSSFSEVVQSKAWENAKDIFIQRDHDGFNAAFTALKTAPEVIKKQVLIQDYNIFNVFSYGLGTAEVNQLHPIFNAIASCSPEMQLEIWSHKVPDTFLRYNQHPITIRMSNFAILSYEYGVKSPTAGSHRGKGALTNIADLPPKTIAALLNIYANEDMPQLKNLQEQLKDPEFLQDIVTLLFPRLDFKTKESFLENLERAVNTPCPLLIAIGAQKKELMKFIEDSVKALMASSDPLETVLGRDLKTSSVKKQMDTLDLLTEMKAQGDHWHQVLNTAIHDKKSPLYKALTCDQYKIQSIFTGEVAIIKQIKNILGPSAPSSSQKAPYSGNH